MNATSPAHPRLTLKVARSIATGIGTTISRTEYGDYLVRVKGSPTGHGYFTDDLQDAIDTARAMAAERNRTALENTNRFLAEAQQRNADAVRALDEQIARLNRTEN